jgi:hypothetical protein
VDDDPLADERPDPRIVRWEAEQDNRFSALRPEDDVRVPSIKFESNDRGLVFPAECRSIVRALTRVDDALIQRVLEADEDEVAAINDSEIDDPPDMATAVSNVRQRVERFGAFCERAADFGGFRVR